MTCESRIAPIEELTSYPSRETADRRDARYFADALNHVRPLTEDELDRLTRFQRRGPSEQVLRAWTAADDHRLVLFRMAGMSATAIAVALDRSPEAIRSRVRHLKKTGDIDE